MQTNHPSTPSDEAPEWASRWLKIDETARIMGESRSSVYRKVNARIYPPMQHFGGSARIAGWELWRMSHSRASPSDAA